MTYSFWTLFTLCIRAVAQDALTLCKLCCLLLFFSRSQRKQGLFVATSAAPRGFVPNAASTVCISTVCTIGDCCTCMLAPVFRCCLEQWKDPVSFQRWTFLFMLLGASCSLYNGTCIPGRTLDQKLYCSSGPSCPDDCCPPQVRPACSVSLK